MQRAESFHISEKKVEKRNAKGGIIPHLRKKGGEVECKRANSFHISGKKVEKWNAKGRTPSTSLKKRRAVE
jgi:hypothetical protein